MPYFDSLRIVSLEISESLEPQRLEGGAQSVHVMIRRDSVRSFYIDACKQLYFERFAASDAKIDLGLSRLSLGISRRIEPARREGTRYAARRSTRTGAETGITLQERRKDDDARATSNGSVQGCTGDEVV